MKLNGNLASKWLDLTFLTWFDLGTYFWSCWRNITQKYIGILVFDGDLENKSFHQIKEKFTEKYSKLIEAGRLELVSAPLDYYPQYIFQHGKGIGRLWVIIYESGLKWTVIKVPTKELSDRSFWSPSQAVRFSSLISA